MTGARPGDPDGEPGDALSADERRTAERVLSAAWDGPVVLRSATVVDDREHVVRVVTAGGRSAVLKRPRRPGDSLWGGESRGLVTEWATLDYLGRAAPGVAPRLYGGDRDLPLVLMEDLPPGRSLAASLLGDDPAAARSDLVAYATTLATLHAASLGDADRHAAVRRRHGLEGEAPPWWVTRMRDAAPAFVAAVGEHGVPVAGLAGEVAALPEVLGDPAHRGLVHGDPCPDNVSVVDGGCRVFDFERSSTGSVVLDFGYLVAPFPSCWCFGRLPVDATAGAVAAYGAVMAAAGVALDAAWDRAVAAALGLWVVARIGSLGRAPDGEDRAWGTTTMRPRLDAWSGAFLGAPGAAAFPRLVAAVAGWRERSGVDDAVPPVPGYPAFATGGPAS